MTHSYFDLPPEEKERIITKATEGSNKAQKELVDRYDIEEELDEDNK